jgi:hypothetical protein
MINGGMNRQTVKLIQNIRKLESECGCLMTGDRSSLEAELQWCAREGFVIYNTLSWVCINKHKFSEPFIITYNRSKDSNFHCFCSYCVLTCICCKEEKTKNQFVNKHLMCYKTCNKCRLTNSVKRETKRVSKLFTRSENVFEKLDFNIIVSVVKLVPRKRPINLLFYRLVCKRFEESIFDYGESKLGRFDESRKTKLLFMKKMDTSFYYNIDTIRVPREMLRSYFGKELCFEDSGLIRCGLSTLTCSDMIKANIVFFGGYDKIGDDRHIYRKLVENHIKNGMPDLF